MAIINLFFWHRNCRLFIKFTTMQSKNLFKMFRRISLLFFLIIFISCSSESIDDDSNYNNNNDTNDNVGLNLMWHSGTSYDSTINVGETITWTWGGGTHNLRSTGGVESFDSGYSSTYGFTFSYTFNNPGITTYVCDPHDSHMFGTVTVIE